MVLLNIAKSIVRHQLGLINRPTFVTFIVTWACNARCTFCDVWKERRDDTEIMSPVEIERIFRQLPGIDALRITGGEPFIRKDIAEIVNRVERVSSPAVIHFSTNGFLTDRIVETVKEIEPAEKIHIKVSIDNIGEKHDEIRGVKGAYDKAMRTIERLVELRKTRKFHIGVNQAIVDENEIESYFRLRDLLGELDVPVYPSMALPTVASLYSNREIVDPDNSLRTYGNFSDDEQKRLIGILAKDGKKVNNLAEQAVFRYYLKGLSNRILKGRKSPNPRCVALNNHLRILPNGDVPICYYNGKIVGNLRSQDLESLWFGKSLDEHRKWVRNCKGCWLSCESDVSAIYTGDIWKGLF